MKPTQAFNDGIIKIYTITNTSAPGEAPAESAALKRTLRFKRRTVGVRRYYAAMQANAKIDLLARVPYASDVSAQDIATVNGDAAQYRVTLVQMIEDSAPPVMDLTLERLVENYDLS